MFGNGDDDDEVRTRESQEGTLQEAGDKPVSEQLFDLVCWYSSRSMYTYLNRLNRCSPFPLSRRCMFRDAVCFQLRLRAGRSGRRRLHTRQVSCEVTYLLLCGAVLVDHTVPYRRGGIIKRFVQCLLNIEI